MKQATAHPSCSRTFSSASGFVQTALFNLDDPALCPHLAVLTEAVDHMASHADAESRGAVYTRAEVVDFILDLVGYTADKPLAKTSLLEPSCGEGDFLLPAIGRLLESWRRNGVEGASVVESLRDAVCAVELNKEAFASTRGKVVQALRAHGIGERDAEALAAAWLRQGDFLLEAFSRKFDYVVGNPPYLRQEAIPEVLLSEYRRRYATLYDRADLYVPFIERSLSLLADGGVLGFICSDRWMKNRYGGALRQFVSKGFHLKGYVDMVGTPAFHSDVSAYTAITLIEKAKTGITRIAHRPQIDPKTLKRLARDLTARALRADSPVREMTGVVNGGAPWLLESTDQMSLLRRIESRFPALEETGCKVGIGVATGADAAFIGKFEDLDVEPERKLPLVLTDDIQSGELIWRGLGVVNPFSAEDGLVDLADFPRFARYVKARKDVIAARHCARKTPNAWYRTLDRIHPELTTRPKLLIPDIKGSAHIVYDAGAFYPHHNLYYVLSDAWDLRALQAVLLSAVTKLFIATYSTQMRGGYLRFQAQYLRRIRLPVWEEVPETLRRELAHAATQRDLAACDKASFKLYGLNADERAALGGNGD